MRQAQLGAERRATWFEIMKNNKQISTIEIPFYQTISCSKLFNTFYRPCVADQVLLVVWWIDCILHHLSSVYFVGSRLENIIVWYDDDMFWAGSSRRNLFKSRLPTPPYAMPYALLLSLKVMRGHKKSQKIPVFLFQNNMLIFLV
jgi:hypothetical protein